MNTDSGPDPRPTQATTQRSPVDQPAEFRTLNGQVIDFTSQEPIANVQIRATSSPASQGADYESWCELDWASLDASSLECRSSERGQFSLEAPPAPAQFFVTAHKVGYRAVTVEHVQDPILLAMEPSQALEVRVENASGSPVPGAVVSQSVSSRVLLLPPDGTGAVKPEWFTRITATTDENGVALFSPLESACELVAEHDGLRSMAWRGSASTETIVLTLRPSIRARGRVHFPGDSVSARASVSILADSAPAGSVAIVLNTNESGEWGPVLVPLPESGRLQFTASAVNTVPGYSIENSPSAGELLEVDLFLGEAEMLRALVLDESASPIESARVYTRWGSEEHWSFARALSSEDGLAEVACPPGQPVALGAEAEGFYIKEIPYVLPSTTRDEPRALTLVRAGKLTGQCLFHDLPPAEFQVTYWNNEWQLYNRKSFSDQPDGKFTIDSVPTGQLNVLATSDQGQTPTITIDVEPGSDNEVTLTFGPNVAVQGRVVDGATGEPLVADIQLYAMSAGSALYPYGPSHRTTSSGIFDFSGLSVGDNFVEANADGFGALATVVSIDKQTKFDMGDLRMLRLTDLEFHVSGHEELGECWLSVDGTEERKQVIIPPDGVVLFRGLTPGYYIVDFTEPDYFGCYIEITIPPKPLVQLDFVVPSDVQLTVTAIPPPGESIPTGSIATIKQLDELGRNFSRSKELRSDGTAEVSGLYAGPALVTITDVDYQTIAAQYEELGAGIPNKAELEIGSGAAEIQIVDGSGVPLPGAIIVLVLPGKTTGWTYEHYADSEGRVSLKGLKLSKVNALLVLGDRRDLHNELDLSVSGPITLTFDANSRLSVTLADKGFPLAGVNVLGQATETRFYIPPRTSDATGQVNWPSVSEGRYQLSTRDSTLWPQTLEVDVTGSKTHATFEVRRRGNLLLTVRNELGVPVANAAVFMASLEFQTPVTDWIADERISAPQGGMRTDDSGQLRVSGVPNGEYTLQVQGDTTTVTVPAWSTLEHEIVLEPVH